MFPDNIDVSICRYSKLAATSPMPGTAVDRVSLPVLDCKPLLSGAALDERSATRPAALLRTLADPSRLRIISLLQAQSSREACVSHVTEHLGLSQPTVSHHLRVLFEAGLVERERRGNWVSYLHLRSDLSAETLGVVFSA